MQKTDRNNVPLIAVSILIVCALTACNLGGTTPTGPGATPIPPSPLPFPSPTTIPADPIPSGANALLIGDYDTARSTYKLATADASPTVRCFAWYGLGMTDLGSKLYPASDSDFTQAIAACGGTPLMFRSYAQRGEARRALNRPADAIADYRQALALQPGLIDSYLYERIALADGQIALAALPPTSTAPDGSATAVATAPVSPDQRIDLQKAADAPRYLAGTFALRDQLAQLALTVGDSVTAVQQYDLILSQATDSKYRAQVEVEAGNALLQAGQTAKAYQRYTIVLTTYSDTPSALDALIALINGNQAVDINLRTKINIANNNFAPVVNYLPDYLKTVPATKVPASLLLALGQAQEGLGQTDQALQTFQGIQTEYPTDPSARLAGIEQGHTYFLAKRYPDAITTYLSVATRYPNTPEAPEALYRAGLIAQQTGNLTQVVTIYDQLSTQYPKAAQVADAGFTAGMIVAKQDPKRAATFFERAGDTRSLLWEGKILKAAGDATGARNAWTLAAAQTPGTFFSLRAHDLLTGTAPYTPASTVHIPVDTAADQIAAETWLRNTFGITAGVSTALSPALAQDPGLLRGTELHALKWDADARAEFDALQQAHHDDPAVQYQLAVYFHGIGVNSNSIIAATRVIVLSNQPAEKAPPFLARLAYPIDYAPQVIADAHEFQIDPLMFASLIRLESNYDAQANSVSDARGLTQIVPSTGQDIVGHLGWPPNYTVEDLYRPLISLRMGAYYLDYVRRYVGGDLGATLAGYNAGMGYASQWETQAGGDLDQLYQTIDIGQAQDYIRYTYENDAMYRLLYGN